MEMEGRFMRAAQEARASAANNRDLRASGMPAYQAAGGLEHNPLVEQCIRGEFVTMVPDGTPSSGILERSMIVTKSSNDCKAVIMQPTRNEGRIWIGELVSEGTSVIFKPSEELVINPSVSTQFSDVRSTAMVMQVFSSTRSTSNATLEGTLDAVYLNTLQDVESLNRGGLALAAMNHAASEVGIPAEEGVVMVSGPDCIPQTMNQPSAPTAIDDSGNDLVYPMNSAVTTSTVFTNATYYPIRHLKVSDGTLVNNLINCGVTANLSINSALAEAQTNLFLYFDVIAVKAGSLERFALRYRTRLNNTMMVSSEGAAGLSGAGAVMYAQITPGLMARAVSLTSAAVLGANYTIVEIVMGVYCAVGVTTQIYGINGSVKIEGYFQHVDVPTALVTINGFANTAQAIEISAKQVLETVTVGELTQLMSKAARQIRITDPVGHSLASAAFDFMSYNVKRVYTIKHYKAVVEYILSGNPIASVDQVVEAAGPISGFAKWLSGYAKRIPKIGGFLSRALPHIGTAGDLILSNLGMFASGPYPLEQHSSTRDALDMKRRGVCAGDDEDAESLVGPVKKPKEVSAWTLKQLLESTSPVGKPWTPDELRCLYTRSVRSMQSTRIAGSLEEAGYENGAVYQTLMGLYIAYKKLLVDTELPDFIKVSLTASQAQTILDVSRDVAGAIHLHNRPTALVTMETLVDPTFPRVGTCAGDVYSPLMIRQPTIGTTITPDNQITSEAAVKMHNPNAMMALQALMAGRRKYPDQWCGTARYPVIIAGADNKIAGSVETLHVGSMPVMNNYNGRNTPARFAPVIFEVEHQRDRIVTKQLMLEESLLPSGSPSQGNLALLFSLANAAVLVNLPDGSYVSAPTMHEITGPSIGMAVIAAALQLDLGSAYTGSCESCAYPGPFSFGKVSYIPAKLEACRQSGLKLLFPISIETAQVMTSSEGSDGLVLAISDLTAGQSVGECVGIAVSTITDTVVASLSFKQINRGEVKQSKEETQYQKQVSTKSTEFRRMLKEEPDALKLHTETIRIGDREFDVPVFNMAWWREHADLFGLEKGQIGTDMTKIQKHIENGSFTKLNGLAEQVIMRTQMKKRKEQQQGAPKRKLADIEFTGRPMFVNRKGKKRPGAGPSTEGPAAKRQPTRDEPDRKSVV